MQKYLKTTLINLPRNNIARSPIFEHNGKFYIKANKPNTGSYAPFIFERSVYSEVHLIGTNWFKK